MMSFLEFAFSGFWRFVGVLLLVGVAANLVGYVFKLIAVSFISMRKGNLETAARLLQDPEEKE